MLGTLEDIDFWLAGVHSTFQWHGAGVQFQYRLLPRYIGTKHPDEVPRGNSACSEAALCHADLDSNSA